jgi:hypothetical protein
MQKCRYPLDECADEIWCLARPSVVIGRDFWTQLPVLKIHLRTRLGQREPTSGYNRFAGYGWLLHGSLPSPSPLQEAYHHLRFYNFRRLGLYRNVLLYPCTECTCGHESVPQRQQTIEFCFKRMLVSWQSSSLINCLDRDSTVNPICYGSRRSTSDVLSVCSPG